MGTRGSGAIYVSRSAAVCSRGDAVQCLHLAVLWIQIEYELGGSGELVVTGSHGCIVSHGSFARSSSGTSFNISIGAGSRLMLLQIDCELRRLVFYFDDACSTLARLLRVKFFCTGMHHSNSCRCHATIELTITN